MQGQRRTMTTHGCPEIAWLELQRRQQYDRDKLKAVKSLVDTRPPTPQPHLTERSHSSGPRRQATTETIFKDLKMIQSITRINERRARTPDPPARGGKTQSLNAGVRKQEILRVMRENHILLDKLEKQKGCVASSKDMQREHQERQKYLINASHTKRLSGDYDKEINDMQHANRLRKEAAQRSLAQAGERREEQRVRQEATAAATLRPPRPKASSRGSTTGVPLNLHTASRARSRPSSATPSREARSRPSSAPSSRKAPHSVAAEDAVKALHVELEALAAKKKEDSFCADSRQEVEEAWPIPISRGEPEEEAPSREEARAAQAKEDALSREEALRSELRSVTGGVRWSTVFQRWNGTSGVDLDAFIDLMRQDARVGVRQVGESQLQAIFEAIDSYTTGTIDQSEFMRWLGVVEDPGDDADTVAPTSAPAVPPSPPTASTPRPEPPVVPTATQVPAKCRADGDAQGKADEADSEDDFEDDFEKDDEDGGASDKDAKDKAEVEARRKAEAKITADREAQEKAAAAARRKADAEAQRNADKEAKEKAEAEAKRKAAEEEINKRKAAAAAEDDYEDEFEEEEDNYDDEFEDDGGDSDKETEKSKLSEKVPARQTSLEPPLSPASSSSGGRQAAPLEPPLSPVSSGERSPDPDNMSRRSSPRSVGSED